MILEKNQLKKCSSLRNTCLEAQLIGARLALAEAAFRALRIGWLIAPQK
jgi:hypothetical protein